MNKSTIRSFASRLLEWYESHGRKDLPWQSDVGAYGVWISEIMLQQTQVQTVVPYYQKFIGKFPDVTALANANLDDVLQRWSGLGYYARARNLHRAARLVRDEHSGVFPDEFNNVVKLPGIGRSTAGAILSLAFGQRHAILDGNAKRVLARHEAITGWPGNATVAKKLWQIAEGNTPNSNVAAYTQAIMDLGATLCTRSKPLCVSCPVSGDCQALLAGTVADYPGRKPKKAKPLRQTTMVLASNGGQVYLERRPEAGIWGGLWSLPELGDRSLDDWCDDVLDSPVGNTESWQVFRHSFSHYDLDIHPIVVRVSVRASTVAECDTKTWHDLADLPPGGIAAPVQKLLEQLKLQQPKKSEHVAHS